MTDAGALSDLRVLDLGHVIAGPFAATLLGDLGADVVKIEHPVRGDTIRALGPQHEGVPLWWKVAGRNKRSLTLDLSKEAGRDVLLALVAVADVLVENFRPGTLERWQIGPDELWSRNPRLVILRLSGYGQGAAGRGRPGFGRIGEAMSGAVHLTGEPDGRPLHVGFSLGDATSGLLGALGVLAALRARDRTGVGEVVDVALFEPLLRMIEWQLPMAQKLGAVVRPRRATRFRSATPSGPYRTSDERWVTVSAATEDCIRRRPADRRRRSGGGGTAFADFGARSTPGGWSRSTTGRGVGRRARCRRGRPAPRGSGCRGRVVFDSQTILDDPYFDERGASVEVDDPELGSLPMPGVQPRLQRSPGAVRWAGPRLGEHNEEILGDLLGLSKVEIVELGRAQRRLTPRGNPLHQSRLD